MRTVPTARLFRVPDGRAMNRRLRRIRGRQARGAATSSSATPTRPVPPQRRRQDRFVWIGLKEPSPEEFDSVAREFHLHELAVEDAIKAHQRPKIEDYDEHAVRRAEDGSLPRRQRDRRDRGDPPVRRRRLHRHRPARVSRPTLHDVRRTTEKSARDLLRCGPGAVLYAIVDRVVDDYEPVLAGIENDIEELEEQVFSPDAQQPDRAHLQAQARGARDAPRHRAARRPARQAGLRRTTSSSTRTSTSTSATSTTTSCARTRSSTASAEMLNGILDANAAQVCGPPERRHAEDLRVGRDRRGADGGLRDLRHELRQHAGAALEAAAIRR